MAFNIPAVTDFQNLFYRDFPYGTDPTVSVISQDITNAFVMANAAINPALWPDQPTFTLGFLLLSAHFMVMTLRASSQGINGQYAWAQTAKSVGSVSETFQIPDRVANNPLLMAYAKTNYGAQYLALLWPLLSGQTFTVYGRTHA